MVRVIVFDVPTSQVVLTGREETETTGEIIATYARTRDDRQGMSKIQRGQVKQGIVTRGHFNTLLCNVMHNDCCLPAERAVSRSELI